MPTKRKIVYRAGDTVKIINLRFVKRVGYPLVYTDLVEEFENHPNLKRCLVLLGLANEFDQINPTSRLVKDFVIGCAKAAVRHRGFGGRERKIYYETETPYYLKAGDDPIELEVLGKRMVKTGTYYPPHSGYSYEGEYDYEPGGLTDEKTHVLLMTVFGEIEETGVELVKRGS